MAAVKYEQLLKRVAAHKYSNIQAQSSRIRMCVCVFSEAYYIRSTKAKCDAGYTEVPKFEKWDSHRKYVISKSRRAEILFLRGTPRYVKIHILEMER